MTNRAQPDDWLGRLEAQARAKQEAFMDGIAARLGRERVRERPPQPFRGAPEFWNEYRLSAEEKIHLFTANFEAAGGRVVRLPGREAAAGFIADTAMEMGAGSILINDEEELASLGLEAKLSQARFRRWNEDPAEDWRSVAAKADIGIVMADYAAAYTGSLVVQSSPAKGRSVSLLPTVLMAIIPLDRLVTRLGEILVRFDEGGRESLPAGIHFISGPSRSADIENDLTIGVHGPGIVYAILVDS